MNHDESFEAEVRATLEGMAREPAPDRLVSRVASIPSQEPAALASSPRPRLPFLNVISGFAAIAAVLAIAVAAVVLRSGEVPGVGTSPSPVLPSSEATLPAVVATPVPSNLVLVPTPVPTPATTPAVAGEKVPSGFRPVSVTFVSADQGWVLGSAPCATGRCGVIAHTLDAGKTWATIPAPPTSVGHPLGAEVDVQGPGVGALRFATSEDGWAFGPELWATHDGGATWKRVDLLSKAPVVALASAKGTVHAVVWDGTGNYRILSTPIAQETWALAPPEIPVGAGPVPSIQLVLSGDRGWLLENDRTVVAGARLEAVTWRSWQPPCADTVGPAYIGASSGSDIVAACDIGAWSTPAGDHLFVSSDGGATFKETGARTPLDSASSVATPSTSTIVIAGNDVHGTVLVGSFDGGRSWKTVDRPATGSLTDLGFTTSIQGVVISTASSGSSHLLMSRDGGRSWSAVTF